MKFTSTAALTDSDRFNSFRTQGKRRSIVGFYLSTLAAFLVVTLLVDSYWPAIPLGLFYVVGFVLLYGSTRGITAVSSDAMDEQQIASSNSGYRISYWAGTMIALAGGYALSEIRDWDTAFELGLFFAVWGLLTALPVMVVAWTLPSEISDEEEE